MAERVPTGPQLAAMRWLLEHPGSTVFEFYDDRRGGSWGIERVSVRGAAGRMYHRLCEYGWVDGTRHEQRLTPAGEALARG